MSLIAFMILAPLLVVSAISVILWKNPIQSALSLVVTLVTMAAFYFCLHAPFVGILQILVYAGAIMVLFVFVIMLINLKEDELEPVIWPVGKILQLSLLSSAIGLAAFFCFKQAPFEPDLPALPSHFGSVARIGELLFTRYAIPFEFISFVILTAIIGAIVLARRGDPS